MKRAIACLILFPIIASAQQLVLTSAPEGAEVVLVVDGKPSKLGVTPLSINLKSYELAQTGFSVNLKKEGFYEKDFVFPVLSGADIKINAQLVDMDVSKLNKEKDTLVNELFEVQRLVRVQNYEQALQLIERSKLKHPKLSTIFELEGSIQYLMKDFKSAANAFRRSVTLNPDNLEAKKMAELLESQSDQRGN
jgi:tetratricopeptide (TPR) repeat protein